MSPAQYQALIDSVIQHEGEALHPYHDLGGAVSIGYGRNLTDHGISRAEAHVLLMNDLERSEHEAQAFPWFAGLREGAQRAVVELLYNMGLTRFGTFTKLIACLARGDGHGAALELRASLWAHQVGPTRTDDLAHLLEQ